MMAHLEQCIHAAEVAGAAARGQKGQWASRFQRALATKFDHRGMQHAAAVWARWLAWRAEQPKVDGEAAAPDPLSLAVFLDDVAGKGTTAVWGVLTGLKWLANHIGMQALPLDSPLLIEHSAPGTRHVQRHAKDLTARAWRHLIHVASQDAGAVSLIAKTVLFMVASSLRFRHAQRLVFIQALCDTRTLVIEVTRGKVRKGAPFRVAVPTHVGPGNPVLLELYSELMTGTQNPGYLIPDVDLRKGGGLSPESEVKNRPMTYAKFMGCVRAILMAEPLSLILADARDVTSCSLRRKLPTAADCLRLDMEKRDELGDWRETPRIGGETQRRAKEPMAVRYSAAKLESAAQTRRVCLLAMSRVEPGQMEEDTLRRMARKVPAMYQEVLNAEWGTKQARAEPEDQANASDDSSASGKGSTDDATSGTGSGSDSGTDAPDLSAQAQETEWVLPQGPKTKLHLCRCDDDEHGNPIPWCRRSAFKWGSQKGIGIQSATETGREWSPRCRGELVRRGIEVQ